MESVSFRVHGIPVPKGSVVKMGKSYLPAGTPASRMRFDLWKGNVATAAREAMKDAPPWGGPIRLMVEFHLPVPVSMPAGNRGWLPHIKRPDWDKLTRAIADPMTGIVWVDDSQVCFSILNKSYAWNGKPGAIVVVDFLTYEWCKEYASLHSNVVSAIDRVDLGRDWKP